MTIQKPFTYDKFPEAVRDEMVLYLCYEHSKEDLAEQLLKCFVHEQMCQLLKDMCRAQIDTGDYYNTAALNTELSY